MARVMFVRFIILGLLCLPAWADSEQVGLNAVPENKPPGYVFDITVENEQQLEAILKRAAGLKGQFTPNQYGRIALVLHGDELRLFQKSNYSRFMSIVDQARELDKNHLIDIKACQTAMEYLHIQKSDLPDFIEQVPFAPVEIDRLVREQSYTRL